MKESKISCDLQSCYLCRHAIKEWIPAVASNRITYHVKKGESIFKEGEKVTGFFFVYTGVFKVHKQWDADKELIVRFAGKGEVIGHRGLAGDDCYPVTGTALETASVCYIPYSFFEASLKVNYDFIYSLLMFFAAELKVSERHMRNLAHMPVKGRIAEALIHLLDKFGKDDAGAINISLNRQDLASFAGTTYETVFRIMNEFVSGQVLEITEKRIRITDRDLLASFTKTSGS